MIRSDNKTSGARQDAYELPAHSMLPLWRIINHAFLQRIQKWGLPPHAAMVLMRLEMSPEDGEPAILAETTCFPRQTITMALDHLEARRLARRGDHPHDRRRKRIVLTAAGRQLGTAMLADLVEFEAAALAVIPAAEARHVHELMASYAAALKAQGAVSGAPGKEAL